MISVRKFVSISVMMLVLLFMFQFSLIIKEQGNRYDTNEYYDDFEEDEKQAWQSGEITAESEYVLFVGNKAGKIKKTVEEWSLYTKRLFAETDNLGTYRQQAEKMPSLILVESDYVSKDSDISLLHELADEGANIVFCDIPDAKTIKNNEKLKALLGITEVREEKMQIEAIKLFEGILFGGEVIYSAKDEKADGMKYEFPWYVLGSGTKTYMVGIIDEEDVYAEKYKNEELPAIIWRNSVGNGKIFAVNADYMKDSTGIGFLSGFMAELNPVEIYPVINAQNIAVVNYPGFASENDENMMKLYSRSQQGVFKDTIWPSLVATSHNSGKKLTCFMTPQYDYKDENMPKSEDLVFYLKQFKEIGAEAGLSLEHNGNVSLEEKIEADNDFFSSFISNYKYCVAYMEIEQMETFFNMTDKKMLKDIRSVVCRYSDELPLVSYCSPDVILQAGTNDGFSHTYVENLRMRSIESALAYTNVIMDMNRIVRPEDELDQWHYIHKVFSSNVETYWRKFKMFESTTLSQSVNHVRKFLNMDYEKSYKNNILNLHVKSNATGNWFVLRTQGESIEKITGGSYKKIENNAYLVETFEENVTIELGMEDEFIYYLP